MSDDTTEFCHICMAEENLLEVGGQIMCDDCLYLKTVEDKIQEQHNRDCAEYEAIRRLMKANKAFLERSEKAFGTPEYAKLVRGMADAYEALKELRGEG